MSGCLCLRLFYGTVRLSVPRSVEFYKLKHGSIEKSTNSKGSMMPRSNFEVLLIILAPDHSEALHTALTKPN